MSKQMKASFLKNLEVSDRGLLEYEKTCLRQKALVQARISGYPLDRLVLMEHLPELTIGRSGVWEDLRNSKEALHQKGVALQQVDRGGMSTVHGPGMKPYLLHPVIEWVNQNIYRNEPLKILSQGCPF